MGRYGFAGTRKPVFLPERMANPVERGLGHSLGSEGGLGPGLRGTNGPATNSPRGRRRGGRSYVDSNGAKEKKLVDPSRNGPILGRSGYLPQPNPAASASPWGRTFILVADGEHRPGVTGAGPGKLAQLPNGLAGFLPKFCFDDVNGVAGCQNALGGRRGMGWLGMWRCPLPGAQKRLGLVLPRFARWPRFQEKTSPEPGAVVTRPTVSTAGPRTRHGEGRDGAAWGDGIAEGRNR